MSSDAFTEPPRGLSAGKQHRRVFLLRSQANGEWLVMAEGSNETHTFSNRSLALGYAGLWASAHAPSQLIEKGADGSVATVREYD